MEWKRTIIIRYATMCAVAAALLAGYAGMIFVRLPGVFHAPEEDMDYAWFVPLFSIWVLWSERKRFAASVATPDKRAFLLAIPCLLLGFLGSRGLQVRFELLAFIGLLIATPWAFFGRAAAARVAFPALCLLFCMPLASYLSILTVHLRLFASATAGAILSALFTDAIREGNMIGLATVLTPEGTPFAIDVANPCSGLRSIFALMAITVGYGYWTQPTWARRAALFACSVPIAIVGNVARIVSICVVAKCSSASFATGFYHDFSGFIVFGVAILLMLACSAAIDKIAERTGSGGSAAGREADPASPQTLERKGGAGILAVPFLYTILIVSAMWFQATARPPETTEPGETSLPELAGYYSKQMEPAAAETNILRGAIIDKRTYKSRANGLEALVTSVTSGADKGSLHRPELCLPSQGFDMMPSHEYRPSSGEPVWRIIPLRAKGDLPPAIFAYTFRNQAGWRTASHEMRILRDVWDRSALGRIDRWTMITVFAPGADEKAIAPLLLELGRTGGRGKEGGGR